MSYPYKSVIGNWSADLINKFFKILPMWEQNVTTLPIYLEGLKDDLVNCSIVVTEFKSDGDYLTLVCILQLLISNPDLNTNKVRRQIFRAINICNTLRARYSVQEVSS